MPLSLRNERARWIGLGTLQLMGWLVYGTVYYVTLQPYNPFPGIVLQQALWATGSGLLFSSLLGWSYYMLGVSQWHLGWQSLSLGLGSIGAGLAWAGVNHWGATRIDPFALPVLSYVGILPGQGSLLSHPAAFPMVLLVWSGSYLGITFWYERQVQQQRVLQADAEAQRARLQMLRYQLNPHFFFNALNTINALADESPRRVKEAVHELSGFLRYSLLDEDTLMVSLDEEVQAVKHYFAIETMRFEDDLQVTVDVDPEAAHQTVPAFLVLPLIENAIKHGQHTSPFPLRIHLTASMAESGLRIEVANTGHLRTDAPTDESTDTGLSNVRARLQAQYPTAHRFTLTEDDGWVHARIEIDPTARTNSTNHG
ncbi:sensor histidine kinase [Longimonas halophila]|uniref:Sensor histidine kinase n=1 Tax=Longimonas halophila TaxID=1469170 RepID=A0A2H3P4R3_9BACT|nr:histidine kinase [Longimonas halophila]PEN09499.1 sensor histidine kinase [Longimonas halophila]